MRPRWSAAILAAVLLLTTMGAAAPAPSLLSAPSAVPEFAADTTLATVSGGYVDLQIPTDAVLRGIEGLEWPPYAAMAITGPAVAFLFFLNGYGESFTDWEMPAGKYRVSMLPIGGPLKVVAHFNGLEGAASFAAEAPVSGAFAPLARVGPLAQAPEALARHLSGSATMAHNSVVAFLEERVLEPPAYAYAGVDAEWRVRNEDGISFCLSQVGGHISAGAPSTGFQRYEGGLFIFRAPSGNVQLDFYQREVGTPTELRVHGLWFERAPDDPFGNPDEPFAPLPPWQPGSLDEDAACASNLLSVSIEP